MGHCTVTWPLALVRSGLRMSWTQLCCWNHWPALLRTRHPWRQVVQLEHLGRTLLSSWRDFLFRRRVSRHQRSSGSNQGFLFFTTNGERPSMLRERNICCHISQAGGKAYCT